MRERKKDKKRCIDIDNIRNIQRVTEIEKRETDRNTTRERRYKREGPTQKEDRRDEKRGGKKRIERVSEQRKAVNTHADE